MQPFSESGNFSRVVWTMWGVAMCFSLGIGALVLWGENGLLASEPARNVTNVGAQQTTTLPLPLSTVVATIEPGVSQAAAWGAKLNIEQAPASVVDGMNFNLDTVTPDAKYLVGSAYRSNGAGEIVEAVIVLVEVSTRNVTRVRTLPYPAPAILEVSADQNWVVWAEVAGLPITRELALYAYNRATQEIKVIAEGGPNLYYLAVDGGVAIWLEDGSLRSMELGTGKVGTLAAKAANPKISWPYVSWLTYIESPNPSLNPTTVLVMQNLQTGDKQSMGVAGAEPEQYNIYQNTVVWVTFQGEISVSEMVSNSTLVLAHSASGEYFQTPTANSRLVTITSNRRTQVWDRASGSRVSLEEARVSGPSLSGNALFWLSENPGWTPTTPTPGSNPEARYIINVLDTSTLPK